MSESWLNLEGKTVIVTGGASGIGKAVAQGFLNAGSNVVISDMAPEAPEMDEAAGKLLYVKTDVTKVADVEAMVEKAKETFGTIDVLVNNAGINIPRLLVDPKDPKGQYELDEAVWDKVCNVNLKVYSSVRRPLDVCLLKKVKELSLTCLLKVVWKDLKDRAFTQQQRTL